MDMESSSRSPDSSCPDYFPYDVASTNRDQSSSGVDTQINSNIGTTNGQMTADLSKNQSYQNNEKTIIQLALRKNGDRLNSTVQSSSRRQNHLNNAEGVSNFPTLESQWNGSSSATNNLGGFLPSSNYQNSSTSSRRIGFDGFYKPSGQVHTSHNPPSCSKPEMPYFASSPSLMLSAKMTAQPKLEHSNVSPASSNSNYLSIPTSNTIYENSARQLRNYIIADPVVLRRTQTTIFPNTNPSRHDTLPSTSHVPQHHASYSNPQLPDISAKPSCMGLKRKAPVLNNTNDLLTAPSSSNYIGKEQNMSNANKKNKPDIPCGEDDDDDDIQIIIPDTSHSPTAGSSLLSANHQRRSVISNHGSLSASYSSEPAASNHNRLLDNQSSSQTTQESFSTIHNPLSSVELEQMLDSVWTDLDEIASSADVTSTADSTAGIESDESSSSSIISIHEVVKESNSLQNSKPVSPVLEEAPIDIPALITLGNSPKNEELQEMTTNEEAENVKEGFKKLIEDELICNICTEVLIKPITLGCSHTFCKFCISEWKEKKRQCPMCRASIETETPCLFLDNFISKAVEQLDPASVEKRLEIIKSREEEQKKKTYKSSAQQPNLPNIPPRLNPRQVISLLTSIPQRPSFRNLIGGSSQMNQRRAIMFAQVQERRQQYLGMSRQTSNVPQASPNIPQILSDLNLPSSNVSDRSSLPLSMFQSPSDITQPFSHQFYQPNLFPPGPPNGYFY